ncbi:hypothetical protein LTR85_010675 [Meristemomyces frigidus]|nr:hypothetical protein LTR85_010675 [Meristemomyces frigidus]
MKLFTTGLLAATLSSSLATAWQETPAAEPSALTTVVKLPEGTYALIPLESSTTITTRYLDKRAECVEWYSGPDTDRSGPGQCLKWVGLHTTAAAKLSPDNVTWVPDGPDSMEVRAVDFAANPTPTPPPQAAVTTPSSPVLGQRK